MNLNPQWVPMKWPCGPLAWARRSKSTRVDNELKTTLDAWAQPAALDLLKGSPINCLVVEWADGGPQDAAQQQALHSLVEAGSRSGIHFIGNVASAADVTAAAASARAAGLAAVMLAKPAGPSVLPAIVQSSREKINWDTTTEIFSATDNDWPGLKLDTMNGDTAVAGPTGEPWVNSNAWVSMLAHALAPGKILWLDFAPPPYSNLAHPADYALAVADSEAYGSRWIISLDDELRARLLDGNPQAAKIWHSMVETLTFFEKHGEWQRFQPQGVLAVASDFRGDNAFMSDEVLNLLNRRQEQFQVMERSHVLSKPAPGLQAILWLDKDVPAPNQLARLLAFVRQGGLVIAATYWGPAGITPTTLDPSLAYRIYKLGQGQIAVADDGFTDPYQVAGDAHLLVSRRHDLVRLYNPATTNCHLTSDPVHNLHLVQILNYAPAPANYVSLWLSGSAQQAQLWSPQGSHRIPGKPAHPGTYFDLPAIAVNCAVEVADLDPSHDAHPHTS